MRATVLVTLLAAVAGRPIDDPNTALQSAVAKRSRAKEAARRRHGTPRRYSVAEIEEQQRNPGATIEYLDDVSAAFDNSPLFRMRVGATAKVELDPAAGLPIMRTNVNDADLAQPQKRDIESCHAADDQTLTDDKWCRDQCGATPPNCPEDMCRCKDVTGEEMPGTAKPGTPAPVPHATSEGPATARQVNQPSAGRMDSSGKSTSNAASDKLDPRKLQIEGNTQRCGFTWEDAAAKCGPPCPMALQSECDTNSPKVGVNSSWINANYSCYADLPSCDPDKPRGECYSVIDPMRDVLCTQQCNNARGYCSDGCICEEEDYEPGDPIEPKPVVIDPRKLPHKSTDLVNRVKMTSVTKAGLPDCLWMPGQGCKNVTPFECVDSGQCSAENYFEVASCKLPCVHTSLLKPAPYYALWRPGPMAPPFGDNASVPHYKHTDMRGQLDFVRKTSKGSILMSPMCKSKLNQFVGVTFFSPKYEGKARRLLYSCERVGVCCKATLLPPNVFGANAPEGSQEFRYRVIALKPAFILSQLKMTQQPVVFLDTDLEFHQYPKLFTPGGWPDGGRDVAIFNYWGNETNLTNRKTPNTGSGVVFFNQTYQAKKVLVAWAECMAYHANKQAPDDQVLDLLLVEGEWLKRASFGWLPAAYLRTMPSYYRGVEAVIDHDHGNPPGLDGHSVVHPVLPPIEEWEMVSESTKVKCLAVTESLADSWCEDQCNMGLDSGVASCPVQSCVCDWDGTWPSDDDEGFAGWDLGNLGIGGQHRKDYVASLL